MEDIMWTADNWKDYEVIDTCGGEKLERWGQYILVRPDPQVIWNTPKTDKRWKKMNGHYHRDVYKRQVQCLLNDDAVFYVF